MLDNGCGPPVSPRLSGFSDPGGLSPLPLCMLFTVLHALELQPVRVEKEHRVVVLVVLPCRVDDRRTGFFQKSLKLIHITSPPQLEGVMVETDVTGAVLVPASPRVGRAD